MITKIEKFGASHCGMCKAMDNILKNIKGIEIENINIEEHPEIVEHFNIKGIPVTIMKDEDGNVVERFSGVKSQSAIEELIKKHA